MSAGTGTSAAPPYVLPVTSKQAQILTHSYTSEVLSVRPKFP